MTTRSPFGSDQCSVRVPSLSGNANAGVAGVRAFVRPEGGAAPREGAASRARASNDRHGPEIGRENERCTEASSWFVVIGRVEERIAGRVEEHIARPTPRAKSSRFLDPPDDGP